MQVQPHPEPGLVDLEEPSKPGAIERDHSRIAVGELHRPVPLRPFSRVQRNTRDQELPLRQAADPGPALLDQAVDLGLLAALEGVGGAAAAPGRAGEGVNSTSRTHSDTLLLETPREAAISARGRPVRRSRRACCWVASLPR